MSRFSLTSFWDGVLKGCLAFCADALFSQHLHRATSLFWQSGKSDMTDLEQKEQSKVWRIKPETNPRWVNCRNGLTFFGQEWSHHLFSTHVVVFYFSALLPSGWINAVILHQHLFYSRVQALLLLFPGLKNWTLQKLLWKLRRKITDR